MSALFNEFAESSAVFSDCRTWRYRLVRTWDESKPTINWLMLNPSIANELKLDPTLRRCLGYSRAWDYGRMIVTNLFALVSTDPRGLTEIADPVGPANDRHIVEVASLSKVTIAGWGAEPFARKRIEHVCSLLKREGRQLHCLKLNSDGSPAHPLYLSKKLQPVPYDFSLPK